MKHNSLYLLLIFLASLGSGVAWAQPLSTSAEPEVTRAATQDPGGIGRGINVPRLIKFSGAFKTPGGSALSGVHGVTLALYKDREGGAPIWLESQNVELDEMGRYTVLLGTTKSEGVALDLFSADEPRWLGVRVQLPGYQEEPRVLLVSVPYALRAADSATLGGKPPSAFLLAPPQDSEQPAGTTPTDQQSSAAKRTEVIVRTPAISGTGTQNKIAKWTDNAGALGNSGVTESALGNILIGGTDDDSANRLQVYGNIVSNTNGAGINVVTPDGTGYPEFRVGKADSTANTTMMFDMAGHVGVVRTLGYFPLLFSPNNAEAMRIQPTGNVGIGTITPSQRLDVAGNINSSGNLVLSGTQGVNGVVFPDGTIQKTAAGALSFGVDHADVARHEQAIRNQEATTRQVASENALLKQEIADLRAELESLRRLIADQQRKR